MRSTNKSFGAQLYNAFFVVWSSHKYRRRQRREERFHGALSCGDTQELDEDGNGDTDTGDVMRESISQSGPR